MNIIKKYSATEKYEYHQEISKIQTQMLTQTQMSMPPRMSLVSPIVVLELHLHSAPPCRSHLVSSWPMLHASMLSCLNTNVPYTSLPSRVRRSP